MRFFLVWIALAAQVMGSDATDRMIRLAQVNAINFYSQISQDKFVYTLLYGLGGKNDRGYYLELGAGDPIWISNSYFFEKNLNWSGISIDISEQFTQRWQDFRQNPLLIQDAVQSDYRAILQSFPKVIDYLSLDIDGNYTDALKALPLGEYTFKVITIEHDFYCHGDLYRAEEREILSSFGYHLLCSDVSGFRFCFEDWWIHPSCFSSAQLAAITSLDLKEKDHEELIRILKRRI